MRTRTGQPVHVLRTHRERRAGGLGIATQYFAEGAGGDIKEQAKAAAQLAGKAYTDSQAKFVERATKRLGDSRQQVAMRYDVTRPTSNKITERLAAPGSMDAISTYHRHYEELGRKLLCRRQYRPGADSMGFTLLELREMVARDEREMPILANYQPSDFDAWEDGRQLLLAVKAGVLRPVA